MDFKRICMGCMKEKPEGAAGAGEVCPYCGFDMKQYTVKPYELPPNTILNGKYLVGKVLGFGGFGITYIALDLVLERVVAIKEYFVQGTSYRYAEVSASVSVTGSSAEEEKVYHVNRKKFEKEAKTLARLDKLPGIVRVHDFFEENDTSYMVLEYLPGRTLKNYVREKGGRITLQDVVPKLLPAISSLQLLHEKGIIHRDISPDNIMISPDGGMTIFDFGGAKLSGFGEKSSVILAKAGYTPIEQLQGKGRQGPWTDEYAAAATIYYCICGHPPVESFARAGKTDALQYPRSAGANISPETEAVILKGLAVSPEDRYPTILEFGQALSRAYTAYDQSSRVGRGQSASHASPVSREKSASYRSSVSRGKSAGRSKSQATSRKQQSPKAEQAENTAHKNISLIKKAAPIVVLAWLAVIASGLRFWTNRQNIRPEENVTLTVLSGSGSGSYMPGEDVTVTASEQNGLSFTKWVVSSGGQTLSEVEETQNPLTVSVEDNDLTIAACYENSNGNEGLAGDISWTLLPDGILNLAGSGDSLLSSGIVNAMISDRSVNTVKIQSGISEIGYAAFENHEQLTAVSMTEGVRRVGEYAFMGCEKLTSIDFGETVKEIASCSFFACSALSDITLPTGLEKIGSSALGSTSISGIELPSDITEIEGNPFTGCRYLSSVTIAPGQEKYKVDNSALLDSENHTLISVLPGVIGDSYEVPDGTEIIGTEAFWGCYDLETVDIPASVSEIHYGAFALTGLSYVSLPAGLTKLGDECFMFTDLTSVTIPADVKEIEGNPFVYCDKLAEINVEELNDDYKVSGNALCTADMKTLIAYPAACADIAYEIPKSITSIGDYAFAACKFLESIEIPETVTAIGYFAFADCENIKAVRIRGESCSIRSYCFQYCSQLETVEIPGGVTEIGQSILYNSHNAAMIVEEGSYAEDYAIENGYAYAYA